MPRRSIPEGWEKYASCQTTVANTRLIPFKTPLTELVLKTQHHLERWTPEDVMTEIPNLGLVINLCFSERPYYVPNDFEKMGIDYVWIPCKGHEVPDPQVVKQFITCVEVFLSEEGNYSRLIGVHCTHGVNRTGYIICRYLMDCLGMEPNAAIDSFETARGYEIERPSYIDALYKHCKSHS